MYVPKWLSSEKPKINVARGTNIGDNYIDKEHKTPLMCVKDKKGKFFWLYDGRLTDLTDSDCGF